MVLKFTIDFQVQRAHFATNYQVQSMIYSSSTAVNRNVTEDVGGKNTKFFKQNDN